MSTMSVYSRMDKSNESRTFSFLFFSPSLTGRPTNQWTDRGGEEDKDDERRTSNR